MTRVHRFAARCGVGFALLLVSAQLAIGQQFRELAVGWTSVGPIPDDFGPIYRNGAILRASIGGFASQRLRFGANGMAVFFDGNQERAVPCPEAGCPHPFYDRQAAAVISIGTSGQFDVDSRGRFFLDAGAGEYAAFQGMSQFRLGVSGGAGTALPIGTRLLGTVQADWHALFGKTLGPRHLFPITLGLCF